MVEGTPELSALPTALFESPGPATFVATELSRGPWDQRHCHGGPVAALLTRACEAVATDEIDWQLARITIELTRPVPVQRRLTLTTALERPGRKVSLVSGLLCDGDVEVARFRALRIRQTALPIPESANWDVAAMPPPNEGIPSPSGGWATGELMAYHLNAVELRFTDGQWADPGPVDAWIRLCVPVVDGESPSGAQRVAAAADFGNGISAALDVERFTFINPDLTIHLLRRPVGEWIGMRTTSYYGPDGAGLAESALFDTDGRLGRSCQSLFVASR